MTMATNTKTSPSTAISIVTAPADDACKLSNKAINQNITTIRRAVKKTEQLIHSTAMMILAHAADYGDCTAAGRLVDSLPKWIRRATLAKWFEAFSPIIVEVTGTQVKARFAKEGDSRRKEFNLVDADVTPFSDFAPKDDKADFVTADSFVDRLFSLAKSYETKVANDKVLPTEKVIITEEIEALKLLANTLRVKLSSVSSVSSVEPVAPADDVVTSRAA
jgi:hypothetical protein